MSGFAWPYVIGLVAVVVGYVALLLRKGGKDAVRTKQAVETVKRTEAGRKGAAEAKGKLAKGKTPAQVKSENDAKW